LPGDPRGFRTPEHRQHVDGDYKSPPPKGKYDPLHDHTKSALKRPPVYLNSNQRKLCVKFLAESLLRRRIEVIIASVDATHFHILARFLDCRADHWIGIAKRETSHFAKEASASPHGGLWARNGKSQPIRNRAHQLSTFRYIQNHKSKGAALWFPPKPVAAPREP
jgi:hypothetical protein